MNNVIDSGSNIIVNATRTANIDKLGETQGFNWLTAFITIIVVLLIAFCGFCCYRREERARKEKASLEREKEQLRWLSERIEEFFKEFLAYQIEIETDSMDLPSGVINELKIKYGKVLLRPTMSVYTEFENKFGSDSYNLEKIISLWIDNNIPDADKKEKSLNTIEIYVEEKTSIEAKNIIKSLK